MRRPFRHFGLTAMLVFTASAGMAFAQTKAPFMEGYPFEYRGKISGLDAWSLPDQEDLWFILPDGETVIAGFAFDRSGSDLVAGVMGFEPVSAGESLKTIFGQDVPEVSGFLTGGAAGAAIQAAPQFPDIARMDIDASSFDPETLVAEMIGALDASQTPEEFQSVLQEYNKLISETVRPEEAAIPAGMPVALSSDLATVTPVLQSNPDADTSLSPTPSAAVEGGTGEAASTEKSYNPYDVLAYKNPESAEEFLQAMHKDTFWFAVGVDSANPVYMVYDPSCPHCARAIRNLEDRVVSGEIQLRLIPVPAVSKDSPGLLAGLLASDDPQALVLENARQIAGQGKAAIEMVDPEAMLPEFIAGIENNIEMARILEVPGVPFFAWSATTGPHFLSGVPAMDYDFDFAAKN